MDEKERNRGYAKKHEQKRRDAGDTRYVVWLSAPAADALKFLTEGGVSREQAFNDAIIDAARKK